MLSYNQRRILNALCNPHSLTIRLYCNIDLVAESDAEWFRAYAEALKHYEPPAGSRDPEFQNTIREFGEWLSGWKASVNDAFITFTYNPTTNGDN